jgi:ABC-2 type transport system ATP-binding protein
MSLVRLQDISKSFGHVRAVDGVSFSIGRGEVVGFLGPNGAGKTTTMRMIAQAIEPDTGSIEIDGVPITESPLESRRRIGYLPEANPLYGDMLVAEFLEYMGKLRAFSGYDLRTRIDRAVEQTGIGDMFYRPIDQLSKGYRQRTGLAQAILSEPDVLVLDEPTEGLDPSQRVEIRKLITHLGADRTVLLSTHVMREVQATCTRLLIINDGKLIADGSVESLLSGSGAVRITVELEAEPGEALAALESLPSVGRVKPADKQGEWPCFLVSGSGNKDPRPDVFGLARDRNWPLWEMRREREDLEDMFRELTESGS